MTVMLEQRQSHHIKNDMNLTFRTSTCEGHLHCMNQDCKYIAYMLTFKTNTGNSVGSTKMQLHLLNPRLNTLPFEHGDSPSRPQ
jgi:hypothetical protein